MIPAFDDATGYIPPGRYSCTLQEVQDRLVLADEFTTSYTRNPLFAGLLTYVAHWQDTSDKLQSPSPLLRSFWIAGSFASSKVDPGDIDITPVIDGKLADEAHGKPGSKMIRKLTQHRDGIKQRYGLEVFPLRWYPVVQPHRADASLDGDQQAYLSDRGRLDDWWERCRIDGSDLPSIEGCDSRRGYLEVRL
ncbi:hypothetical protein BJY24_001978 [Nocardia transvalensis]|uniref:Uncharacterized protein n=1 Tax=Nocardia transvalensis TaxID=37333 RepID=A0A7W9UHE6_9NOCA|nr:hypothetical protein [Nocardia transvalensis]MBB5913111.1 hypothetical protein [Nocardia transvalensis]